MYIIDKCRGISNLASDEMLYLSFNGVVFMLVNRKVITNLMLNRIAICGTEHVLKNPFCTTQLNFLNNT